MKLVKSLKEFRLNHPHAVTVIVFLLGFLFDIFTLGRVDDLLNFFSHLAYLILLISIYSKLNFTISNSKLRLVEFYKNDIFHFLTGSLLSSFTIYYVKSSSLTQSSIFILFVLALLVINEAEIFQKSSDWIKLLVLQFCVTSFTIIYLPVLIGITGTITFIISVILSSLVLPYIFKKLKNESYLHSIGSALVTSLSFFILYIFNIIPPVPLSIKEIGVYHQIKKVDNKYKLYKEVPFWKFWAQGDQDFIAQKNDKVYIYARIFAPKRFKEKVYIQWEKWNKTWKTSDKIPMSITGGNSWGYKAYSYKSNYTPGIWRAKIITEDSRELGRVNFHITLSQSTEARKWQIDIKD
jgi:hypothetical protein